MKLSCCILAAVLLAGAPAFAAPYVQELCRQIDVVDYPEIPGYGTLPFKVFQPAGDWKCEKKEGVLQLEALKKTTVEKEWDNDALRQKLSFRYEGNITLTVYVTGAHRKVNVVREKLSGGGAYEKVFTSPHLIENTRFDTVDQVNEHVTADKIRLRMHLEPGAKLDAASVSFTAVPDTLTPADTPYRTSSQEGITSIRLPEDPDYWQLFAACRLRKYLYLRTGKMLPFTVGKRTDARAVNIGFPPDRTFGKGVRNAFRVTSGRTVTICADRSVNLVHGSYELLERCGFRFYSRFHQVIPASRKVVFPEFECERSTSLTYRRFIESGDMIAMGYSSDKLVTPAYHGRNLPHHNDIFIVPAALYETQPELFALGKDGKRRDPRNRREQPKCFSNPEVRRLYRDAAVRYMKALPQAEFVLLSTCDFHNWCLCGKCRAGDREGSWTRVFMDMINGIAAEIMPAFPGKKIRTYAYSYTSEPVPGLKMHPAVTLYYAFYKPYFTSDSVNGSYGNREGWRQLEGWLKSTAPGGLGATVYPTQFNTRYALTMPFSATCERIRWCKDHGFDGMVSCGVTFQFEELMTYIWGKMFWNDDADVQKLIKEHMTFFYGEKSAPYMTAYFNRICRHVKEKRPCQYCEFPIIGSVTPELLKDLHELLDKAVAAAPATGRERRALMRDRAVLLFSELNDHNVNNSPLDGDYVRFARRAAELIRLLGRKERFTNSQAAYADVSSWFSYVTGVEVKNRKFWLDPAMKTFLAAPAVRPRKLENITGNVISGKDFTGGQFYPNSKGSRAHICVRRASSPWSGIRAEFAGDDVRTLTLTGMTELGGIPAEISVNGRKVFSGEIKFSRGPGKWGEFEVNIPAGILRKERNTLELRNICPDPPGNAPYTYGWIDVWRTVIGRK
ncbi:MAG: DUF4838 domain-containing protein [Lentisphaeria bacterium]|nr:DUF4838 domain-containing protein [Lentisphaeria bacterium]